MNKGHIESLVRVCKKQKGLKGGFYIRGKWMRFVGLGAISLLVVFAALTVRPIVFKNREAEAVIGDVDADPSITTLNVETGTTAKLEIAASSATGTFAKSKDADMATFKVTTDNYTGYTANLSGAESELKNSDSTYSIKSIADAVSEDDFKDGVDCDNNNCWGYQVNLLNTSTSSYDALNDGKFLPAPAVVDKDKKEVPLNKTSVANPIVADTYGIRLGAMVDYMSPKGDYTNTFTVAVVANPVKYSITYVDSTAKADGTGGEVDTSTMPSPNPQTDDEVTATSIKLSSTVPSRTGYTFKGWCLGVVNDLATTCTASSTSPETLPGKTFAAGADFGLDQTMDNTKIKLYALWTANTYDVTVNFGGSGVSSVTFAATGYDTRTVTSSGGKANLTFGVRYTMTMAFQTNYQFDSWAINNSDYGTLESTSTNPSYFIPNAYSGGAMITATGKVSKLYMQNLASSECTTTYRTVYDNRDGQSYVIQRLADGNCWMMTNLNLGAVTLNANITPSNSNVKPGTSISPSAFATWNRATSGEEMSATTPKFTSVAGTDSNNGLPYGTLYNYCAVSGNNSDACVASMSSQLNPNYDICPAGWRLPIGGPTSSSTNEFNNLYKSTNYNTLAKMRASYVNGGAAFTLAGYFYATTPLDVGNFGVYWSSTWNNTERIYNMRLRTYDVNTAFSDPRYCGLPMRCVLK